MRILNQRTFVMLLAVGLLLIFSASSEGQTRQWNSGPSLGYARHGLDTIEHNGNIYAIGGWNGGTVLEVLYTSQTSWTQLASLPTKQEGLAAALVGDKIYTFGSYGPSDICQIYNITSDTWQAGPNVPTALYWSTAEAVGEKIYLIAGYLPGSGSLDSLYILDTVTGTWTQGLSLPQAIQIPASAVFGNNIYAFGKSGGYFKYDIVMDSWTSFTGPLSGHGYASEAVTVEDKIYLIGGSSGSIYVAYKNTEIYDPVSDTWTIGPDLYAGRYQFGAVYLDQNKKLYAVGGRDEHASSIASVEILDIALVSNPVADIKANGSDGPLVVNQGTNLTIYTALVPCSQTGSNADWWLAINTPFNWYHYNLPPGSWSPGFAVTHQGPLFHLDPHVVFNASSLPLGTYTFYFGVDMDMNGVLNLPQAYYDSIVVTVM